MANTYSFCLAVKRGSVYVEIENAQSNPESRPYGDIAEFEYHPNANSGISLENAKKMIKKESSGNSGILFGELTSRLNSLNERGLAGKVSKK